MQAAPKKHEHQTVNLKKDATNKGTATLSFIAIIIAALAIVVFPLSFWLMGQQQSEGTQKFGKFCFILAWLHVVGLLVLSVLILDKYEKGPCHKEVPCHLLKNVAAMRSGYAIPPPAY